MPALPNLFVVGAMKAGTTTLHELLDSHPDIAMSDPKEPTRFVDGPQLKGVSRRAWEAGYWRDEERYLALFEGAGDARFVGESSTAYTKRPRLDGAAERIADFCPEARIIYILRDPVERTVSHYLHAVRWNDERRTPLDAIRRDPHYREVSHYAMQLEPYRACFEARNLHVLTLEALRDDVDRELRRILDWLGLDPVPAVGDTRANRTADEVIRPRGPALVQRLRHSPRLEWLRRFVPPAAIRVGRQVLDQRLARASPEFGAVAEYLRPLQTSETAELSRILGRDFPEWTTLRGV